jgi:hypothetical protein
MQEQVAQTLAKRRAPGLAGQPRAPAAGFERLLKPRQMRALARAIDTFDGDQAAAG